jgi:acetyl esterase
VDDLNFSGRTNKVLKLCRKAGVDCFSEEMTQEQIEDYNHKPFLDSKVFMSISPRPDSDVYTKTFLIPVEGGLVTGYFFEKLVNNTGGGLKSLIICFHGGGWTFGNMDRHSIFCNHVCSITGASVLSVDYRLAPAFKFPTALDDCYATLVWAEKGTRYWGVDPDKVYLMGEGAGGNLAIGVAKMARDLKGPHIAGMALMSPVTDCRMRTKSYEEFADGPVLTAKVMAALIKNYQREPKDIMDPKFSPLLSKDLSRLPGTLVFVADHDVLSDDGRLFAQALMDADTPVKLLEIKDTFHGFYQYPEATGTEEFDNALRQFFGGRNLSNIELLTNKQRRRIENNKVKTLFG